MIEGRSVAFIAAQIGVSEATAWRDRRACEEEWRGRQAEGHQARVARALARLDRIDSELWSAWERSKEDRERRIAKTIRPAGAEERSEAQIVTEGQAGDPRFLFGLLRSAEERAKIEGTYAPTRSVEEIYLGVDAVFDGDTVEEERRKMEEILARVRPVGLLPAPNGNGAGPSNGNGTNGCGTDGNGSAPPAANGSAA